MMDDADDLHAFLAALDRLPIGYGEGWFEGVRWGATLTRSADRRRQWLFAEALDGGGHVSFNLYRLAAGAALRPCEMAADRVTAFVLGFRPDRA